MNAKKWEEEQKANILSPEDMIVLKKKVVAFILPKENVNQALIRIRGKKKTEGPTNKFKKNIRTKTAQKLDGFNGNGKSIDKEESNDTKKEDPLPKEFNELLSMVELLFDSGYQTVYTDSKEDIEDDIREFEITKEREEQKSNGWAYKIIKKTQTIENEVEKLKQSEEVHGPFSTGEMLGWIKDGYFAPSSEVNVQFKKYKLMGDSNQPWLDIISAEEFEKYAV